MDYKGAHFEKEIILWGQIVRLISSLLSAARGNDGHHQGLPEQITIEQSGSNTTAINRYNKRSQTAIIIR